MDIIRYVKNRLARIPKTRIKALYEDDFIVALKYLGIYEEILAGKTKCVFCGKKINLDNLQAIVPKKERVKFVCSDINCWSKYNKNI